MPIPDHADVPIIDRDQFDMLVEAGEDEAASMIQELLDLFTEETGQKLPELHEKAAAEDRLRCNRIAHAIAGASANLGGQRLAAYARSYENAAATLTREDLISGAATIEACYDETVEAFHQEIAKL